jgi:hypothetical protein
MHNLDLLIKSAREFMQERGYSQSTICHHTRSWIRLQRWYEKAVSKAMTVESKSITSRMSALMEPPSSNIENKNAPMWRG